MKHIHANIACAVLGAAFAVGIGTSLTYGESPEIASPSPSLRKAIETRAVGETLVTTFDSDAVVSNSSYQAYSNDDWGITFGGNNISVGTNTNNKDPNKDNRPKCVLTGDNAKYAVAGVTTASAIYNINPLENIGRIALQYTGGSNNSRGVLYLLHSDDNVTFDQVNLTGEFAQGGSIGSTNTEYSLEFDALDGYFALVIADTGDSGAFRFDEVVAEFYSVSTTPIPDDVKPVSISLAAGEGKLSYYAGDEFDPTGFEVSLTYGSESDPSFSSVSSLEVDDSRLTWNHDLTTVGEGKELTVTFVEGDVEFTSNALTYDVLEAPDGQYYYFGEHSDFSGWTSSYTSRTLAYPGEFSITFASANKQSSTITDMPVSKGNEATLTSEKPMSKIEFGFKQWGSKSNTASLYIDGGSTAIDSAGFLDGASSVSYVSDSPFSTAKVDWSNSSNQVGWNYVYIEYASVEPSQAESYAEMFLESMTCDGKGAITAVEGTWETLSELYADLSDSDKGILKQANANKDSESLVEQAVARYDYIVGKYGVEQYPDFMGRTPARIAEARSVDVNDQTAAWVIAGISAAGIASAAAFFFLRRRKEA